MARRSELGIWAGGGGGGEYNITPDITFDKQSARLTLERSVTEETSE